MNNWPIRLVSGGSHRHTRRNLTGALALAAVLVVACSGSQTVTLEDSGSELKLEPGDEFELVLNGNPSTGYMWTVEELPAMLEAVGEPEFRPESNLVGAVGEFVFRFVAVDSGVGKLSLIYERSFEETEPIERFDIEVDAR